MAILEQSAEGYYIGDFKECPCIMWDASPVVHITEMDGILVEIQWGWSSGMTDQQRSEIAEDSPNEYDSIIMNLEQAKDLRDSLNVIIEKFSESK